MYVRMHACMYVYVCECVCVCICMYVFMYQTCLINSTDMGLHVISIICEI